jgi:hypothetical protein
MRAAFSGCHINISEHLSQDDHRIAQRQRIKKDQAHNKKEDVSEDWKRERV